MNRRGFCGGVVGAATASAVGANVDQANRINPHTVPVQIGVAAWALTATDTPPASYTVAYYRDGVPVTDPMELTV